MLSVSRNCSRLRRVSPICSGLRVNLRNDEKSPIGYVTLTFPMDDAHTTGPARHDNMAVCKYHL